MLTRELDSRWERINIAYEAVDRHAQNHLKNTVALRFIRKDRVPRTLPIPI
jgi:acetyl-CoA synthetase